MYFVTGSAKYFGGASCAADVLCYCDWRPCVRAWGCTFDQGTSLEGRTMCLAVSKTRLGLANLHVRPVWFMEPFDEFWHRCQNSDPTLFVSFTFSLHVGVTWSFLNNFNIHSLISISATRRLCYNSLSPLQQSDLADSDLPCP